MHPNFPDLLDEALSHETGEKGFFEALDNSALLYHLDEPPIPCKSPADALFGLLHLHYRVADEHELLIDSFIHHAKYPEDEHRIWDELRGWFERPDDPVYSKELAKRFALIKSRKFLNKTTIESTEDIEVLVRTHRQERMMKEYDRAEGMPLVAVMLVAEVFGREFLDFEKEVSRPNVGDEDEIDGARKDLRSMALVHRTWTRPAQAVLKRRVILKSWAGARKFLINPLCGPWTRELVFDPPWLEIDHSQDEDDEDDEDSSLPDGFERPSLKNPWPIVCKLLKCMPNLRQLAISLLHRTTNEVLSALRLDAAEPFAKAVGELQSLEGLLVRSCALHDTVPERLFFTDLCKSLAKLRHLRQLGLYGFFSMDVFPLTNLSIPPPYPPIDFGGATPPPLRRLAFHIPDEPLIQDVASQLWLLKCKDSLEDLFIHFSIPDDDRIRERFTRRMLRIFTPNLAFLNLKRLKFIFIDDYVTPYFKGTFGKLCLAFIKNCTRLTHLHLSFSAMPKVEFPESLESLRLSFDWDHALGSDVQRFAKWGVRSLKLLESSRLPNLKKVVIETHCREPFAKDPKGVMVLKMVFGDLLAWCISHNVSIRFEDERNHGSVFDGRVNEFVFPSHPS
ncbi:hypothetical protein SCHPADRAFT_53688 [Schizopora paradoxa]|uniref:Uncharacterized protein n=1 Tax=Schizopora paradoxa TaxID=27342 RepID=A0A0H2S635_9AGAM|nr:hypothetical protein SCHPADRAFT_53688 [Schizopora paradoxa]